jgi:hypothetical protein
MPIAERPSEPGRAFVRMPAENRRKSARIPLDLDCLVKLGRRTYAMRIENASATGLLLRWDFKAYLLLKTGSKVVAQCRMGKIGLRAEGKIVRVEYRRECVRIALCDVTWFQ